jgi:hypothetical protein
MSIVVNNLMKAYRKKTRPLKLSKENRRLMNLRIAQARLAVEVHEEPGEDYAATDLICNLLHYLREVHGLSADDAIARARSHYDAEIGNE